MAKLVSVPALRAFSYQGRRVAKGERVEMSPIDAAIHARKRDVSLSKSDPPSPADPKGSRRRYRRRDLRAED